MKRLSLVCLLMVVTLIGTLGSGALTHADSVPMTEAHIARIKANCVEAQTSLNQLHSTDGLLRVNQGQLYELISTRLMTPLNTRIALNHLDGTDLIATTATYENELTTFRSAYLRYEASLSNALKIKCTDQPVAFYDNVADARTKRQAVHASVLRLNNLLMQYRSDFTTFSAQTQKGSGDNE